MSATDKVENPAWRLFEKRGEIARLKAQLAELEAECAKLREAMICFAREEGYDLDTDQDVVDFFMLYLK